MGVGFVGHWTLKSGVSQKELVNWVNFLYTGTNSGKLKIFLIIIGWV